MQDLLKCLALITMVIDHVGAFLYQEELWWRVIGRAAFPIWFFLAGYRTNFAFRMDVFIAACLMLLLDVLTEWKYFPLDILWNYLFTVFVLGLIHKRNLLKKEWLGLCVAFVVFFIPLFLATSYGLMGLAFALCGYMVRHDYPKKILLASCIGVAGLHMAIELQTLDYSVVQQVAACAVIAVVTAMLFHFTRRPVVTSFYIIGMLPKHMSRHALHYYVLHLWVIQWIAYDLGTQPF